MISVNIVSGSPGKNEITVRLGGQAVRTRHSSPARADFETPHAEAHRIALQVAREFREGVVCRRCEVRNGEGGVR